MDRSTPRTVVVGAFVVLSAAGIGLLRGRLNRRFDAHSQVLDVAAIPRPLVARVLSLGHTEWATDVLWVNATIYFGETLYARLPSRYVERYAVTMQVLDPRFREAYLWAATALIYRVGTPTLHDVDASITELRQGLEVYPGDAEMTLQLGFDLAFERTRFFLDRPVERGVLRAEGGEFLRRASLLGVGPPWLSLTAATLLEEAGRSPDAIELLRDVLLRTTGLSLRTQIEARLRVLQHDHAADDPAFVAIQQIEQERRRYAPYLPASLFVFVGTPMVGAAAWTGFNPHGAPSNGWDVTAP